MAENKLDCDIVQDLLPSYADGLTRETTNNAIEAHLAECSDCSETLRLMKEPENREELVGEVDYLKKVHKRMSHIGMICGIVMMFIGMFTIFARVFLIGSLANVDDVNIHVVVSGNTVYVIGDVKGSTSAISRVVFEESASIVNIKVYTAPKTFFNSKFIEKEYHAHNDGIGIVRSQSMILWENNIQISTMAAKLYNNLNPYVGDISGDGRIATILGVMNQLGAYTSELHTTDEPFGWDLNLENTFSSEQESSMNNIMTADSYVMLACISNLGYVTWNYTTENGKQQYVVTKDNATEYMKKDIKSFSSSASELEKLIQSINIKWAVNDELLQETGVFRLRIDNFTTDKIYGLIIDYYVDDYLVGKKVFSNSDGTPLNQNEEHVIEFKNEDFQQDTSAIDLFNFHFNLSIIDKDGNKVEVCKNCKLQAKYAWVFNFTLNGNYEKGFTLQEG